MTLNSEPFNLKNTDTEQGLNDNTSDIAETTETVEHVYVGGRNKKYIYLGSKKFLLSELCNALNSVDNSGSKPVEGYKIANPGPLGLCAFALTTFVLSFYNIGIRNIKVPNVVVGLAIFYGGLVQLLAGMWEMVAQNTFGAVAFSSYGAFWLSYGAINIPWFGIMQAYDLDSKSLTNALAIYLLGWSIFTIILTFCTMKSTVAFFSLFLSLSITFLLLSIAEFSLNLFIKKAGGIFGIITAIIAWYNAYSSIATRENSYVLVRSIPL